MIFLKAKVLPKLRWRRQALGKIDASKTKGDKGRTKHKGTKSKVIFVKLYDKYRKKSEEKNAYQQNHSKKTRSPLGTNLRIGIGEVRISM